MLSDCVNPSASWISQCPLLSMAWPPGPGFTVRRSEAGQSTGRCAWMFLDSWSSYTSALWLKRRSSDEQALIMVNFAVSFIALVPSIFIVLVRVDC